MTAADDRTNESEPNAETPERVESETPNRSNRDDPSEESGSVFGIDSERFATYVRWSALLVLGIVVLIAGGGLYSSLGSIIDVWVADRYQPFARAGLNFALLCGAIAGIVATLRRL